MRISFLGAARTTTGSMHMIEANGKRLILDCGLYQGKRKQAFERNRNLPFDPKTIDYCLLSHAHIDHSGNLPTLVKRGFRGQILCTSATRDLCAIMLLDSAHHQDRDVYYVNKRRIKQGKKPFEPLYDSEDVFRSLERFKKINLHEPVELWPGVVATFHEAGHILGSTLIELNIEEKGRKNRLLFTGDLGRKDMPIIRDPKVVSDVNILITESTYGNRLHPKHEDVKKILRTLIDKVVERKSRLIVPAFSVGRTQRLLYRLQELHHEGNLKPIPVSVDSPLSVKATYIYEEHPECYDNEMKCLLHESEEPFSFKKLKFITRPEDSRRLNDMKGPMMIISASGMCEGGRILHHLKHSVENPDNIVLITGYQAEHTLGRRLLMKASPIKIFGELFYPKCEVIDLQALSAHADRNELIDYFKRMGPEVDHAFVVHGEMDQAEPLAKALEGLGARKVTIPERDSVYEI